jgi:uncharacterized protein DUF4388
LAWKTVNDHNNNIAARLSKLAAAGSTGSIPITGPAGGTVYFQDGDIIYAESDLTPKSARTASSWPAKERPPTRSRAEGPRAAGRRSSAEGPRAAGRSWPAQGPLATGSPAEDPRAAGSPAEDPWPAGSWEAAAGHAELTSSAPTMSDLASVTEATVDAATDLLSSRSACGRFCVGAAAPISTTLRISVADLLSEVARRRRLLGQLTGITADTAVARNPEFGRQRVQVSSLQWALLIRVQAGSTPRDLAWALGRSVFGTTAEVHRLMALGLVAAAGPNAIPLGTTARPAPAKPVPAGYDQAAVRFMHAVSEEKGSRSMPVRSRSALRRQDGA